MKKSKIQLFGILLCLTTFGSSFGQISDIGKFFSSGTNGLDDTKKIMQAYVKPFTNAYGYNISAGWYNTAKVHSLLGFDLTFTFNVTVVPTADKTFDLNSLGLTANSIGTPSIAQTIVGKNEPGPAISYNVASNPLVTPVSYNTPGGINWAYWPAPIAQLGIGLVKGTEIIGRFTPEFKLGSAGKLSLWGIGLKHSIKQWIPAVDNLPFLNLSVMGGYSSFHSINDISLTPDILGVNDATGGNIDFSNQQLDLKIESFTANAIVSIDIPVLTVYAGLGISSTSADMKMLGNYPIPNPLNLSGNQISIVGSTSGNTQDIYANPLSFKMKAGTKPRLNIGFKIKMGLIALNFDYTNADYSIITTGLGISFR